MAPKGIRRFLFPKPAFLAFHVELVMILFGLEVGDGNEELAVGWGMMK